MDVARATITFDARPQISIDGQKKDFAQLEVGGKKFEGVDLGSGNFAKLKSRQDGKFDVVLFRGDRADISKMSVNVDGGSVSRLRTTDDQRFAKDSGTTLKNESLTFDSSFAASFTKGLNPLQPSLPQNSPSPVKDQPPTQSTNSSQGLPPQVNDLPPSEPPPPLPPNVRTREEFFNVAGLRTNSQSGKIQHTFGDMYSSFNELLVAESTKSPPTPPSGGDRLIGTTGNKPEERLMGAFAKWVPHLNSPAFQSGGKAMEVMNKFMDQIPRESRLTDMSSIHSLPNNGGLRSLYLPMKEMVEMAQAGKQDKFQHSAQEFQSKASNETQKFLFAGEFLTNPKMLAELPKDQRASVRSLGEAYLGIAKELADPQGAVQRGRRFAAEVVKDPAGMMASVQREARHRDVPRTPTREAVPTTPPETPLPTKIDLEKINNPKVRAAAEKLADRVDKFQKGVDQAAPKHLKELAGLKVEGELQKLFQLADSHNDPGMLEDLLAATSFVGKLSPFEPTTAEGRAAVRAFQLFAATRGDGSYETVKQNILGLATSGAELRGLARDPNLLAGTDKAQYVDANRLLRTVDGGAGRQISDINREWYLEQATLMKAYRDIGDKDPAMQKKLALTMLQSFGKAAPLGTEKAERLAAQSSPLLNIAGSYHRSASTNPLLEAVRTDLCKDINKANQGGAQVNEGMLYMVDNATFREVIARDYGMAGVKTSIGGMPDFHESLQQMFAAASRGVFPENKVLLDVTDMYKGLNLKPGEMSSRMVTELEKTFLDEAEKYLDNHPEVDKTKFGDVLMKNINICAMSQHKGVDLLLAPSFLITRPSGENASANRSPMVQDLLKKSTSTDSILLPNDTGERSPQEVLRFQIEHTMMHSGYRLDPIQARQTWIEVAGPEAVLGKYGIQLTELATSDRPTPTLFASFKDFTQHSSFKQFQALASGKDAPPYLKILPKATVSLLEGLASYKADAGGIDKEMRDKGLNDVLQTSYFRMMNAMAEAVHNQGDMVAFSNSVEVLQQQVATMVTLLEPHGQGAFGDAIRDRMSQPTGKSGEPVIPKGVDKPGVQLKPSAMHCLASILSSVESLTGRKDLNVCVVKDHYYESAGAIQTSRTYSVSSLDGDELRSGDGTGTRPLAPHSLAGKKPLDLYVCDFHHNISLDRNHYQLENLTHHVDEMFAKKLVSDKFTVAIDCTIDFVNSEDVQAFLKHNEQRIKDGQLNVVLFRSAQKFDMFGMDNYYGGFSVSVNNHEKFKDFNTRMDAPGDQSKGPSLQGLSHNAVHGGPLTDEYRGALMDSTKRFYDALPEGLIWKEGNTSAMIVAKTDDPNAVFLDIKFPGNEKASEAFMTRLKAFADQEDLPLTGRASFGFATTNLNLIHGEKTRLTPGLEGPDQQDRYIEFFKAVHTCANDAVQRGTSMGLKDDALKDFVAQEITNMPSPPQPVKLFV